MMRSDSGGSQFLGPIPLVHLRHVGNYVAEPPVSCLIIFLLVSHSLTTSDELNVVLCSVKPPSHFRVSLVAPRSIVCAALYVLPPAIV